MKISHKDALQILGVSAQSDFTDIKQAYHRSCSKYHPDRNPAGLEMMKLVNAAWSALQDYVADKRADNSVHDYGDEINSALNAIINLGLDIEICGAWVWVSGDTRTYKDELKQAGFKWAPVKKMWHFRPSSYRSFSRGSYDMDKIRSLHGSVKIFNKSVDFRLT